MEDKKSHPSLPSNYVTLAHLQERWLKEQQRKLLQEEKQQHQLLQHQNLQQRDPHQPPDRVVALQRHGTASKSAPPRNHCAKQFPSDSDGNRPAIEVNSEDHRKLEANDRIGDENADLDSKGDKSKKKKKKKVKRKPRVDKEGREATEAAAVATMEVNKSKKNRVKPKPRVDKGGRGATEGAAAATMGGNKDAEKSEANEGDGEKATIKSELDDKSSNLTLEVEKKFEALSVNSESGKQNVRLRRVPDGFLHSQSRRNYCGRGYCHGPSGGGFYRQRREVQKRRSDNMIWVRKDGDGGGIEISTGSYT